MDNLTWQRRRKTMSKVKSKNTKPEMVVRRLVHGLGYRYRLHKKDLPGKPDMVFAGSKKVIFIHGCFWHGHECKAGRNKPASNTDYWLPKLKRNWERDQQHIKALNQMGLGGFWLSGNVK